MAREVIRVVAAVIEHDGRYLITQRNANAVLPLLWEFPGGRVEPGESETGCLLREVKGRIGVEVVVRVGAQKRTIILPPALAAYRPRSARFEDGALNVRFERSDDGPPPDETA